MSRILAYHTLYLIEKKRDFSFQKKMSKTFLRKLVDNPKFLGLPPMMYNLEDDIAQTKSRKNNSLSWGD